MSTKHCIHCGKSHSEESRCPQCGWAGTSFDVGKMEQMARATGWKPPTIKDVKNPHPKCAKCGETWEIVAGPKGILPQGYGSCPHCNHGDSPYRVCGTCGKTWIAAMMYDDPKNGACPHCSNRNEDLTRSRAEISPSTKNSKSVNPTILLLRLSLPLWAAAFWLIGVFIPSESAHQSMKGGFLLLFLGGQVVCSFLLARRLNRGILRWMLAAVCTFNIAPIILAFLPAGKK